MGGSYTQRAASMVAEHAFGQSFGRFKPSCPASCAEDMHKNANSSKIVTRSSQSILATTSDIKHPEPKQRNRTYEPELARATAAQGTDTNDINDLNKRHKVGVRIDAPINGRLDVTFDLTTWIYAATFCSESCFNFVLC